jgi:uncharacterized protein DUF5666
VEKPDDERVNAEMDETPYPGGAQPQPEGEPAGERMPAPFTPNTPPTGGEPLGATYAGAPYSSYGVTGYVPQPVAARGRGPRWPWLVGVVTAVALILALGFAVGAAISGAQAANGSPNFTLFQQGGRGHGGPWDGAGRHGPDHMGLTVTQVSGQTITAKRADGASVAIHVSSSTTYERAGKQVGLSAVSAGETIGVMGQRNSDGSVNATRVVILLPGYRGPVSAVSGSTITITDPQGAHVIHVSGATAYRTDSGSASSLSAVVKGAEIEAVGTKNSDGSLNAEMIEIETPRVGGQVSAISGTTITVTDRRGTETIHVSASTQYDTVTMGANGPTKTASSLSAVKAGAFIMAEGTRNSDGSLNAQTVYIMPAPAGGPWNGGPHDGPPNGTQGPAY